jgi:hypothetical protein
MKHKSPFSIILFSISLLFLSSCSKEISQTNNLYNSTSVFCNGKFTEVRDVINPTTGKTWMDRNLGASRAAINSNDSDAYGDLYQWGRRADGHQCRNSSTTSTLSSTDQPTISHFILAPNSPYDWRTSQNADLWQGVNGINNPCPTGYRLPTKTELDAERSSWSLNNSTGAFGSPLKLPMAGDRSTIQGSLLNVGSSGYYWSCTVNGAYSWYLYFLSDMDISFMGGSSRATGYSVRCLKD